MTISTSERETLKTNLDLIEKVRQAVGDLAHRQAVPVLYDLDALRDNLCEALPGGFYSFCEACELPFGCDEEHATGEDDGTTLCGDCLKHHEQSAA